MTKTVQIPSQMLKQLEIRQQVISQSTASADLLTSERNFFINKCLIELGQDPKLKWNLDFNTGVFTLVEEPIQGDNGTVNKKQNKHVKK